jgi:uncharacterized delta-60 repeat protein
MKKIWSDVIAGLSAVGLLFSISFAKSEGPGSLDPSFGKGGIVNTSGTGVAPLAAVQQSTGEIVVFGAAPPANAPSIGLLRYTPSGQLDTTFGTNGITITDIFAYSVTQVAVAVQPNDDILVLEQLAEIASVGLQQTIALVRYTPDGALDPTFGDGGIVETSGFGASALLLQPNGQIVVGGDGGFTDDGEVPTTLALLRYNSDGTMDTSFGTGGIAQTPSSLQPAPLALLSNGDYLTVELGLGKNGETTGSVLEFNSAGVLQSQVTQAPPTATSTNGNFQSNGEYVVASSVLVSGQPVGGTYEVEATRFTESGKVDSTFSSRRFLSIRRATEACPTRPHSNRTGNSCWAGCSRTPRLDFLITVWGGSTRTASLIRPSARAGRCRAVWTNWDT